MCRFISFSKLVKFLATMTSYIHLAPFFSPSGNTILCMMVFQRLLILFIFLHSFPFSFCFQSFPVSGSFPMSRLFPSGNQSIGASASAPVFSMNIQGWFPLGLTSLISVQFKGLPRSLLQHHNSKASILLHSAFFMVQLSHPYMTTEKTIALTR